MVKTIVPDQGHVKAMKARKDSFQQFMRNGVWGTCVDCPKDNEGRALPEFCEYSRRGDHLLTMKDLADSYEAYKS